MLLVVVLGAVLTDFTKTAFHAPRPYQADARVHVLGWFLPGSEDAASTGRGAATFGFPSGHVEGVTALAFALWWIHRRRTMFVVGTGCVGLTAVSRLYLGRHYIGDVIGGCLLGLLSVPLAWALWQLDALIQRRAPGWTRLSLWITVCLLFVLVIVNAHISPLEAGRLCGLAVAAAVIIQWRRLDDPDADGVAKRAARVLVALIAVGTGVVCLPGSAAPETADRLGGFALTALLNAAVLLLPVLLAPVSRR